MLDSKNAISGPIADGVYVLHMRATGNCLDVSGASTADGAKVQEWSCNGTVAQNFQTTSVGGGYYSILNTNANKSLDITGKSLDITGQSTAANALLQQWTYWAGANRNSESSTAAMAPSAFTCAAPIWCSTSFGGIPIIERRLCNIPGRGRRTSFGPSARSAAAEVREHDARDVSDGV
jgi:hypothetical protein